MLTSASDANDRLLRVDFADDISEVCFAVCDNVTNLKMARCVRCPKLRPTFSDYRCAFDHLFMFRTPFSNLNITFRFYTFPDCAFTTLTYGDNMGSRERERQLENHIYSLPTRDKIRKEGTFKKANIRNATCTMFKKKKLRREN
jgi:hypothetical protein